MTKHVVAVIEWRDSARYDDADWKGPEEDFDLIPMTTFGVLVRETKTYIVVAQDFSGGRNWTPYRGVIIVPKVNIVKIHRIEVETA